MLRSPDTCRNRAVPPRTADAPSLQKQKRSSCRFVKLDAAHSESSHRSCCCSPGCQSLNWDKLCCTWSNLPPGFRFASAFSSSPLRSHSCRDSPGRREGACSGSSPPWWQPSQAGRRRRCLGKRCRSPSPMRCSLWLWRRLHYYYTSYLKYNTDKDTCSLKLVLVGILVTGEMLPMVPPDTPHFTPQPCGPSQLRTLPYTKAKTMQHTYDSRWQPRSRSCSRL